jgi:TonB family protein
MKRTLKLGTVIVLLSAFTFAQVPSSPEKKSAPPTALDPHLGLGARVPARPTARIGDIEITTDTQGVDFGPYLQRVLHDVKQNWYAIVPETARPPLLKGGKVVIEFEITQNGQISGLRYANSSGDGPLDRAAYGGITASSPFPPLPAEFHGQSLGLRFRFLYNPSLTAIAPSDAQVRVGSSLQFSPVFLKRIIQPTDTVITWSVAGGGCTGSECGTISEAGLYTAPLTVPKNPYIRVKATADADLGETASAVVTIVPPEPSQSNGQH